MRCFYFISFCFFFNFSVFSQSDQLAQNYLDQGAYEKALKVYQQLVKSNPGNPIYFYGMISAYQQLEDFATAETLLNEKLKEGGLNPSVYIELGHNSALKKDTATAANYYKKAIEGLEERPNFIHSIARTFEKYSLLDYAAQAYLIGIKNSPDIKYELPLARIYGEQGKLEQMFTAYMDLIDKEPELSPQLVREFDRYILEDPENPANKVLRKVVLQRLQQNPALLYNDMLSWLFVQQKEFGKAFTQEKAIYRRNNKDLQRIIQLTILAKNEGKILDAKEMVEFIIAETPSDNILLQANQLLLEMKIATATPSEYAGLEKNFQQMLEKFGTGKETLALQVDFANFLAFKMGKISEALEILKTLQEKAGSSFEQAAVKMALADILVLDQKFNQALIYFSQIQNLVKNTEIAQQARFKVAKTSYYKGDFDWAKTQLDVLKKSSTQLIANDAMELSLLIRDNSLDDSTQTALKLFARADLLAFQNKNKEAIAVLDEVLLNHKGEKIEDEAWLKQAELFEAAGEFKKAEANYLKILEYYRNDILADNATYRLAELYNEKMEQPDKAREYYEQIIFNFPDSIYFVDARKKFRLLRGDAIE